MSVTTEFTTDSILELVVTEIEKRIPSQTADVIRGIIDGGGTVTAKDLAQVSNTIQAALGQAIKSRIIEGLDIVETIPPSGSVIVKLGKGYVNGKIVELDENRTLPIPLDSLTAVFYITLDSGNALAIERRKFPERLTLARIVIPKPGITSLIEDDKPIDTVSPLIGWIVSAKDAVFEADQEFDEDSIEALKQAIVPILAETIIGTIKLSDSLKILSIIGTVEIDSQEVRIKYGDGTVAAKFNKFGTFFFDQNGIERARFTATDAAIGNAVKINTDGIEVIGPNGMTVVRGGEIKVDDGSGASTIINSSKIFIGQKLSGQGIDLANADGTRIFIDINGVDGQFIKPESIDATSIKANTITADNIAAGTITAAKLKAGEISADKFNSTLYGDLNQAIRYAKKVLSSNPEFEKLLTQSDLNAGTKSNIDTANVALRLSTQNPWDSSNWDTGTWDIPVFASGDWNSATVDIGQSQTGQFTLSVQVTEDNAASTSIVAKIKYSTDNVSFGSNSPTFNDDIFETLTESATGGASDFTGSILTFRYIKIRIELTTLNTAHNITLSGTTFKVDQVTLVGFKDRQTIASGGTSVTYTGFNLVPAVTATIIGDYPGFAVVTTKSTTAATVKVFSGSTMTNVGGIVDISLIGA